MLTLAILIGIYSYIIFFLGISGWLYKQVVDGVTVAFALICISLFIQGINSKFEYRNPKQMQNPNVKNSKQISFGHLNFEHLNIISNFGFRTSPGTVWNPASDFLSLIILFLLFFQIFINFIGALGPETAFDALWYHLTFPKIYLLNHRIFHMNGIFYYSDMPKLTEMVYTGALALQSEILAKIVHFSFGILCLFGLYKLARKFFDRNFALLAVLIFYSSLVVGWESITAYVDLSRTFFELMALWAGVEWYETRKRKWIVILGLMIGLAITTKLLAAGSLAIFTALFLALSVKRKALSFKLTSKRNTLYAIPLFWCFALLIPFPWFIFSFIHTGNPVYPFFTNYPVSHSLSLLNPMRFFRDIWLLFTRADDPISPVFIGFLPLIIVTFSKMSKTLKFIGYYALLAILVWYITPRSGGGRFILPYLPAFSLLSAWCIFYFKKTFLQKILIVFVLAVSIVSIGYRGIANAKYIPVIMGKESKSQFLTNHLNFSFGDFYDTDGYFAKHIKSTDCVDLIGFFNLYYVDFPINDLYDSASNKCRVNYIATQHAKLPKQYVSWKEIYENKQTGVNLYR